MNIEKENEFTLEDLKDFELNFEDILKRQSDELFNRIENLLNNDSNNKRVELVTEQLEYEKNRNHDLNQKLSYLKSENMHLEQVSQNNKKEIQDLKNAINQMETEIQQKCEDYQLILNEYSEVMTAFDAFKGLSQDTRRSLMNIFKHEDLMSFLSSCFDWENIESLWNYIKVKVIEKKNDDLEKLLIIFDYMFVGYNSKFFKPQFRLIKPIIGEKHNNDKEIVMGTRIDGHIIEVLLSGYEKSDGRVIEKALVKVEE